MSRDLEHLQPFLRQQIETMVDRFENDHSHDHDHHLLPYCTRRSMVEQARAYRRTRRTAQVMRKADHLRDRGYHGLAAVLIDVGPVGSAADLGRKHRTKAAPGESFHQYGLAADCAPVVDGKIDWDDENPDWQIYGRIAEDLDLVWAGHWHSFPESPHVQVHHWGNPLDAPFITPSESGFPVLDGREYRE